MTELKQALLDARDEFINGQVALALESLERLSQEAMRLEPSPERWQLQRSVLTRLAQVEGRSDKATERTILLRTLTLEPEYRPDPKGFPPSFIAEVNALRDQLKRTPTNELQVSTEPEGIGVVVDGRPMGFAPMTLQLPPGVYRLEGMWGYRGLVKTVEVAAPPQPGATVVLTKAMEGSITPDAGPCVLPVPSREAALGRIAELLKVKQVYAIRSETSGNEQRLVATQFDAVTGREVREAREGVVPPDTGPQAAARLGLALATPVAGDSSVPTAPAPIMNTGLRNWSYIIGAVGLATTTVGVILYFSGNSKINQLESQYAEGSNAFPPSYESTFQSQNDSAKTNKTVGAVVAAVGVATLATGVALFFISASGGKPNAVAVHPYLGPGGGGAVVSGRF